MDAWCCSASVQICDWKFLESLLTFFQIFKMEENFIGSGFNENDVI